MTDYLVWENSMRKGNFALYLYLRDCAMLLIWVYMQCHCFTMVQLSFKCSLLNQDTAPAYWKKSWQVEIKELCWQTIILFPMYCISSTAQRNETHQVTEHETLFVLVGTRSFHSETKNKAIPR